MRAAPATASGVMKALAASRRCIFGCNCLCHPLRYRNATYRVRMTSVQRPYRVRMTSVQRPFDVLIATG